MNVAWSCKIGPVEAGRLPFGADLPMRQAVQRAFKELTGEDALVTSSGWGIPDKEMESE